MALFLYGCRVRGGMSRELLTTDDVAKALGVSRVSVHRWIVAGKLKCSKTPGGHRRVTREELFRFAKANGMAVPAQLLAKARVLIIDDDPRTAAALKRALERESRGALVANCADDAFAGLLRAGDEKPDAVLIDGSMAGVNGVEACRAIKANPRLRHIVVIGYSGHAGYEEAFGNAGAAAFLEKPFEVKQLIGLLRALRVLARPPTHGATA